MWEHVEQEDVKINTSLVIKTKYIEVTLREHPKKFVSVSFSKLPAHSGGRSVAWIDHVIVSVPRASVVAPSNAFKARGTLTIS